MNVDPQAIHRRPIEAIGDPYYVGSYLLVDGREVFGSIQRHATGELLVDGQVNFVPWAAR
jgi:hypothetical protein